MAQATGRNNSLLEELYENWATVDTYMLQAVVIAKHAARFTSRYRLGEPHRGRTFCIWLLVYTSLSREMASKLTSFLAS